MNFPGASWIKPGLICGLTLAAVVIAAVLSERKVLDDTRDRVSEEHLNVLDRNGLLLESRLRSRVNDLFTLKTLAEDDLANRFVLTGPNSHLAKAIASLMYIRTAYDRVSLINADGREILCLNWKPGGSSLATSVFPTPAADLQDLSATTAFREMLAAKKDSSLVFPIVPPSRGSRGGPTTPILRLSGQIRHADGSIDGILALDLDASQIWNPLEDQGSSPRGITYVFDSVGEWLVPPAGEDPAKILPAFRREARSRSTGSFAGPNGEIYCFRRINPNSPEHQRVPLRMDVVGHERLQWTLLSIIPRSDILKESAPARFGIWLVCGIAALVLIPCAWFGTNAIERRILALREISSAKARLDRIINAASHGICAMTAVRDGQGELVDFRVSTINFAAEKISTWNSRKVGRTLLGGRPSQEDVENFERYREIVKTGQALSFEQFHPESSRWVYVRAAKCDDGIVISFADVTARKRAEDNLHEAKDELEKTNFHLQQTLIMEQELSRRASAAEHAKTEFLAMMSHEIRTPMNGVLGFTEMLAQTSLTSPQREYVQTIATSGDALLHIIDEILDFSRIEAGRLDLENTSFSAREVVESICTLLRPEAQARGLSLEADISDDIPTQSLGDPGRLRQVLVNLVGNALKFTETGSVVIGLRRKNTPSPRVRLKFFVRDTGLGIPEEKISRIFEPFTQADSSIARRFGGAGLGLAISQRLVALMGGVLQAVSEPGKGSLFSFTLPFASPHESDSQPLPLLAETLDESFAVRHPLHIMVAEDDPVNLKLTTLILRKLGYEPLPAINGSEALALFRSHNPDCILMDMQMPEMDGLEATRQIRAAEKGQRTFISALTANVLPEEQERCFRAGMDDYLTKPLKQELLASLLIRASLARPSLS
ncbi:hypothetical protein BH09VER1_BH09VER1_11050 [soil metagenome]